MRVVEPGTATPSAPEDLVAVVNVKTPKMGEARAFPIRRIRHCSAENINCPSWEA
jgi:hypothetical protein